VEFKHATGEVVKEKFILSNRPLTVVPRDFDENEQSEEADMEQEEHADQSVLSEGEDDDEADSGFEEAESLEALM